jgi:thioredoxin reductase
MLHSNGPNGRLQREPYRLETSMPGVFVAGDVRKGSVKRLTCAVGEGAMAIQYFHQYGKARRERQQQSETVVGVSGVGE